MILNAVSTPDQLPPFVRRIKMGIAGELRAYIRVGLSGSKHAPPATRFVVFAQGRTGSTLLVTLLNSNPSIHCDGEILRKKRLFPGHLIAARSRLGGRDVYGFKLKIYQLWAQKIYDARPFVHGLHEDGWKVIYLKRRNILRQVISRMVARHRQGGLHWSEDGPVRLDRIHVDCGKVVRVIEQRKAYLVKEAEVLEGLPLLPLVYEDHLLHPETHQETVDDVFGFLGVPSVPVETNLIRITSDRLPDFIANYDELVQVIEQTEHADLLRDEGVR